MEQVIANINSHHLNQVQVTSLTIEPVVSLIGHDSYTPFSQKLLKDTTDTSSLNIAPTITKYLKTIKKQNKTKQNKTKQNKTKQNKTKKS